MDTRVEHHDIPDFRIFGEERRQGLVYLDWVGRVDEYVRDTASGIVLHYIVHKTCSSVDGRVGLSLGVTLDTDYSDVVNFLSFRKQIAAEVAALVHRHSEVGHIAFLLQFGICKYVRDILVFEPFGEVVRLVLEHRRHDDSGRIHLDDLVAYFPEVLDVVLVVADFLDLDVESTRIFGGFVKPRLIQGPEVTFIVFRDHYGYRMTLVISQHRGVDVRFVSLVLDDFHHLVVALLGNAASIVQYTVDSAVGKLRQLGDVLYSQIPFSH